MAAEWYYIENGQRRGPVDSQQLKRLAEFGQLQPTDMVWKNGLPDWRPASQVKGLFAGSAEDEVTVQSSFPVVDDESLGRAVRRRPPGAAGTVWQVLLICAGGLLLIPFLLPWWSIVSTRSTDGAGSPVRPLRPDKRISGGVDPAEAREYERATDQYQKRDRAWRIQLKNRKWYSAYDLDAKLEANRTPGAIRSTAMLWGWHVGVALTGFLFGFLFIAMGVVAMAVKPYRRWSWISCFAAGAMGLLLLVFAAVWYFSSPGENVPGLLEQGVGPSPGPYLEILGALTATVAGICGGILGLLAFLRRPRASI